MKNPLFPDIPDLPEDLSTLSDDEITAALKTRTDIVVKAGQLDEATVAPFKGDGNALVASVEAGVTDIELLKAEIQTRKDGEKALTDKMTELTAGLAEEDAPAPDGEPEPEPETPEVTAEAAAEVVAEAEAIVEEAAEVVEAEAVVAAARMSIPKAPKKHEPIPREAAVDHSVPLLASAGLKDFGEGKELDRLQVAEAMIEKRYRSTASAKGSREQVVIASASWQYEQERILDPRDPFEVRQARIDAVVGDEALTASGGLCAPVTNYYELANVSVADRPVRDALAAFQAVRGGLKFAAVPVLGDVTTAISYITEAEDALGGTFATKSCQVVACPEFSEVDVAIIAHCVQFGNLGSRAFPEQVAQFNELVMAAHARVAETALLDGISAASTQVTAATALYGYAGTGGLLAEILTAAAGIRSRNRMAPGSRLRVILPEWVKSWLVSDLVNSQFVRFEYTIDGVVRLLREIAGVEPSFTLDGETAQSQVYGAQTAGALLQFPANVRWYIFPEGSWLFLDGGELELGIVRDSVLNATNDFQIFGETFENVAFVGVESLAVTSHICPQGSTGGPVTAITCP